MPGSASALETVFNDFMASLQALSTSPDFDLGALRACSAPAQVLAQQLNSMTADIQGLRSDAELGLADAVAARQRGDARIAQINRQLGTADSNDATAASLLDQRDRYIDELAQLMDINVVADRPQPGHACSPIPASSWSASRPRRSPSMRKAR